MEALRDYMHLPAVSSPAVSDLSVPMERLDLADWHEELHDEIEWMREILLPEINQEYLKVCQVWFENPVSALEEDKKFLELTLEFLSLTRDDKIKWSKDDCFYFVRRIKSYLLHLRDLSYGNLVPGPQEQRNEEAVLTEPPSLRKWPRLAKQLDLMYEEFQSLKDTYLPILSIAYGMYCKFFLKRGKKYRSLMLNFGFCTSFLRRPKDHLLLISMDVFDYYVRKIKLLVTGVEPTESWCSNNRSAGAKKSLSNNDFRAASTGASLSASSNLFLYHGASSVSRVLFEMESADWHNELHKEIESMRKTDMGDVRKFYKIVRGMCHEGVELTAELEEDKIALDYALRFLSVSRAAKISLSKEECCVAVKTVKMYALRYRIEYCQHHHNSKQQEQGSRDSTCPVKGDGWLEELHNKIDAMKDKYLSEIEEAYRRVCIMPPERLGTTGIVRGDMFFLGTALNFLRTRRNDKEAETIIKDICFGFLKRIEVYVVRYRKSDIAMQHLPLPEHKQLKTEEVEADGVNHCYLLLASLHQVALSLQDSHPGRLLSQQHQ